MTLQSLFLRAALGLMAVGLTACGTMPTRSNLPPEEAVAQLAKQRWDHLIAGEWEGAYGLLTEGYREANALQSYERSFVGTNVKWVSAEVSSVTCSDPQRCIAAMQITFELNQGLLVGVPTAHSEQIIEETWLNTGKAWGHLPRK